LYLSTARNITTENLKKTGENIKNVKNIVKNIQNNYYYYDKYNKKKDKDSIGKVKGKSVEPVKYLSKSVTSSRILSSKQDKNVIDLRENEIKSFSKEKNSQKNQKKVNKEKNSNNLTKFSNIPKESEKIIDKRSAMKKLSVKIEKLNIKEKLEKVASLNNEIITNTNSEVLNKEKKENKEKNEKIESINKKNSKTKEKKLIEKDKNKYKKASTTESIKDDDKLRTSLNSVKPNSPIPNITTIITSLKTIPVDKDKKNKRTITKITKHVKKELNKTTEEVKDNKMIKDIKINKTTVNIEEEKQTVPTKKSDNIDIDGKSKNNKNQENVVNRNENLSLSFGGLSNQDNQEEKLILKLESRENKFKKFYGCKVVPLNLERCNSLTIFESVKKGKKALNLVPIVSTNLFDEDTSTEESKNETSPKSLKSLKAKDIRERENSV